MIRVSAESSKRRAERRAEALVATFPLTGTPDELWAQLFEHKRTSAAGAPHYELAASAGTVSVELPWSIAREEALQRIASLVRFVAEVDDAYAARSAALAALEQAVNDAVITGDVAASP